VIAMSRVVQEVKVKLPPELMPEKPKPPAPEVKKPPEEKKEEKKPAPEEAAQTREQELKAEDRAEFQYQLTVQELATIFQVLLFPFKISGITIYLKPRTEPPLVEGS